MITENSRGKAFWASRRGILEIDIVLELFMSNKYDNLSDRHKEEYLSLLSHEDTELLVWLVYKTELPSKEYQNIVKMITDAS